MIVSFRNRVLMVGLVLGLAGSAHAQFRATVVLDHLTILQGEPVRAKVTVTNDSLSPLVLGAASDDPEMVEVDFRIIRREQDAPVRLTKNVFANGLSLEPGDGLTMDVDIGEWYRVYDMGQYRVSATWTSCGRTLESDALLLDVVSGLELSALTKEVPFSGGGRRTYSLRYWSREGSEHLFLRVSSEDGNVFYGVFELGELVRVFDPTISVDRFGAITVVHQVGMNQYRRSELKSTGEGVRFMSWTDVDAQGAPFQRAERVPLRSKTRVSDNQ
jgi:hypothetical protein